MSSLMRSLIFSPHFASASQPRTSGADSLFSILPGLACWVSSTLLSNRALAISLMLRRRRNRECKGSIRNPASSQLLCALLYQPPPSSDPQRLLQHTEGCQSLVCNWLHVSPHSPHSRVSWWRRCARFCIRWSCIRWSHFSAQIHSERPQVICRVSRTHMPFL